MILQAYPYLHFDDIRQALSHADGDLEVDYARMREAPGRCSRSPRPYGGSVARHAKRGSSGSTSRQSPW